MLAARLIVVNLLVLFALVSCRMAETKPPLVKSSPKVLVPSDVPVKIVTFESFREQIYFDESVRSPVQEIVPADQAIITAPKKQDYSEHSLLPDHELDSIVRNSNNINYCKKIDRKLSSVSFRSCLLMELKDSKFKTNSGRSIYYVEFESNGMQKPLGKVLVLGGVHGDELTSVSTVYRWIQTLKEFHSGLFEWRVVPIVNPDGFFKSVPTRTNANGVDLNRNLPTYQWNQLAKRYWKNYAGETKRKFPGNGAASEPETRWIVNEINSFRPDVIITVHAPYNLVDYDAADRSNAPRRLGILRGKSLGTFPGSLGRYAGEERNIPVITLELPHAYTMPPVAATNGIWLDMVDWLRRNINSQNYATSSYSHCSESLGAVGCI